MNQAWAGHPGRLVMNSTQYFETHCARGASGRGHELCILPEWQVWSKPLPGGSAETPLVSHTAQTPLAEAIAVLVVNNANSTSGRIAVGFEALGLKGAVSVRDLHARTENGTLTVKLEVDGIPSHGSVMVLLTPYQSAHPAASPSSSTVQLSNVVPAASILALALLFASDRQHEFSATERGLT